MKHFKYILFVLLAGTCTGIFFYTRSLSSMRLYAENGMDSSIIWAFSSLTNFLLFVLTANLFLFLIWMTYSLAYALYSEQDFSHVLRADAYTYLPLCVLGLSLFQFNTLLTYHFEGLLLFSGKSGYLLFLITLIAVYHLKIKNHSPLETPTSLPAERAGWKPAFPGKEKLAIFLISFLIYASVGIRFVGQLGLGGDEPHYLLLTHSLLHDHDLAISNNYKQGDYKAFFQSKLDVHVSIGKNATRYSIHPIGMPLLMLPVYAINNWQGTVRAMDFLIDAFGLHVWEDLKPFILCILFMNLLGALLATQLFLIAFALTHDKKLSLLLWGIISFTPPLLLYSSQLYPEAPSALLLAFAYYIIRFGNEKKLSHSLLLGISLAYLPWLQQRMILATILLGCYHLIRVSYVQQTSPSASVHDRRAVHSCVCTRGRLHYGFSVKKSIRWTKQRLRFAGIPIVLLTLSGIIMAGYYYWLYGYPLPNAPYLSIGMKSVFSWTILLKEGLLGLLLDQEGGLLVYAPYFLFVFAGFLFLFRQKPLDGIFLLLIITSIYIPCAGFTLKWRGAWSPVSRYMVAMLPVFFVPFCLSVKQATRRIDRYILFVLTFMSFLWSARFLHTPLSAIMWNNGINRTFQEMSNLIDLTRYVPSFTATSTTKFPLAAVWIIMLAAFSVWLYRSMVSVHSPSRGNKSLKRVYGVYGIIVLSVFLVTFTASRMQGNTPPYTAKNRYLRDFLSNFQPHVIARNQISHKQPLIQQELRFEYINREKSGEVNRHGERFILSGPRAPYPKGKYTVYFKMWIEENSTDQRVATLDVAAYRGSRVYIRKAVHGTDFLTSSEYEIIPVSFELTEDVTDLETRVFFHNRVHLKVKKVYIEPNLAEIYYDAGLAALQKARDKEANALFLQATSVAEHSHALYQLARLAQKEKEWQHSIPLLERAIAHTPDFADAHYRLGRAYRAGGQFQKAQESLEKTIGLLPAHLDAWEALQKTYQQLNMEQPARVLEKRLQSLYQPQHPYTVNFSNQLMFLGYSIRNSGSGKLHIEYYWKALTPMRTDYVFFVHFKNSETMFQQDHAPHMTDPVTRQPKMYPTSQWRIGEIIKEEFDIHAPKGKFSIQLGVWDMKQRLPMISPSSNFIFWRDTTLELTEITID